MEIEPKTFEVDDTSSSPESGRDGQIGKKTGNTSPSGLGDGLHPKAPSGDGDLDDKPRLAPTPPPENAISP